MAATEPDADAGTLKGTLVRVRLSDAATKDKKAEVTRRRAEVRRLMNEEILLSQDVAAEQARWTELNQRLEELERALVRR